MIYFTNMIRQSWLDKVVQIKLIRGAIIKKTQKILGKIPNWIFQTFLNFRHFWKNGTNYRLFWNWERFDGGCPLGQTSKLAYLHQKRINFIEKSMFILGILDGVWGLLLIQTFVKNCDPPPSIFEVPKLKLGLYFFHFDPTTRQNTGSHVYYFNLF